jgi:hypothetical protein
MFMDLRWKDERVVFDPEVVGSDYEVFVEHAAEKC